MENKMRYIDVPVLAREIAKSIVEREYSDRILGGIYELDENGEVIKDSEGEPMYNDAAAAQIYHLLMFYSGMIRDHLVEPEELKKLEISQ